MRDEWMVIPYEPEHAMRITETNLRGQEAWFVDMMGDLPRHFQAWKDGGPAFTMIVNGMPVACAGVILMDWNRGEAWSLLSTDFRRYRVAIYRAIRKGLENISREKQLRRVQSLVDPQYSQARDFIECLDFCYEGRLRAYGPHGEDYLMFARVQ